MAPSAWLRLPSSLPDPMPLRRVLIPAEAVPRQLERARGGVFINLTRADFEARVQRAAWNIYLLQHPPRVLEMRYRARLLPEGGLAGKGEWKIVNPTSASVFLPISGLALALTRAQLDGSAAVVAELEGKQPGLLVEGRGEHKVMLEWTARGDLGPNGLRFRLEIPPCPLTSFEFELPESNWIEVTSENCLLSSPKPAAGGGRLWRLDCAGKGEVDFVVRRAAGGDQSAPLILARLQTRQSINLDQIEADFDFNLEIAHGSLSELSFECDPSLRPVSVSVRGSESEAWVWQPGTAPESPAHLHVPLPAPIQTGIVPVHLHFLAPAAGGSSWRCPGVRLPGALLQGETLALWVAPEIRLVDWQPGDFELVRLDKETGAQVLHLITAARKERKGNSVSKPGIGSAGWLGIGPERPGAQLRLQEPQAAVRQLSWWQVGPTSQTLTVVLAYEVTHGPLFRIPVRLTRIS